MNSMEFEIPEKPVTNPGEWTSDSLDKKSWKASVPDDVLSEMRDVLKELSRQGLQAPDIQSSDVPAPLTQRYLTKINDQLENGLGFVVLHGFSTDSLSSAECENLFWSLGLLMGTAVPISADGALLGHVTDLGFDLNKPTVRNYQTREELTFHNDSCDVLGLMCLQQAKAGGHSAIASAISIHNDILQNRPDLLAELYKPLPIDRRGERGWPEEGDAAWFSLPIFSYVEGKVSARYTVHDYYYESQKFEDAPRMSSLQREAMEYLKQVSVKPEHRVDFHLAPGDIQLVNNYCVFHSRTHYEDYDEPERKRHLLRLWLSMPNSRRLHSVFKTRFRNVDPGKIRGGIAPRNPAAPSSSSVTA